MGHLRFEDAIGAVVPFTLIVIMPTNHELLEPGRDLNSSETRRLGECPA
jgi:hypothetical protein